MATVSSIGYPRLLGFRLEYGPPVSKAIPYGVYDVGANDGFVSVGVDHDTTVFAVTSIEAWRKQVGVRRYAKAREIFVTADAGGSNGYRSRIWRRELQRFAERVSEILCLLTGRGSPY